MAYPRPRLFVQKRAVLIYKRLHCGPPDLPLSHIISPNRTKSSHEKAGQCQGGFFFFLPVVFLLLSRAASVPILPSAFFWERCFARCQLGVLSSAGAAT